MPARRADNARLWPTAAQQDNRTVITDDKAGIFAGVTGDVLTAGPDAHLASTHYQDCIQTAR